MGSYYRQEVAQIRELVDEVVRSGQIRDILSKYSSQDTDTIESGLGEGNKNDS